MYAALTVGLTFLLGLLRKCLQAAAEEKAESLYRREEWEYSRKEMDMEYAAIESRDVVANSASVLQYFSGSPAIYCSSAPSWYQQL